MHTAYAFNLLVLAWLHCLGACLVYATVSLPNDKKYAYGSFSVIKEMSFIRLYARSNKHFVICIYVFIFCNKVIMWH